MDGLAAGRETRPPEKKNIKNILINTPSHMDCSIRLRG